MKTIKEIAGNILLYFYAISRKNRTALHDFMINFQVRHFADGQNEEPTVGKNATDIYQHLKEISRSDNDLYEALRYLYEGGFIGMNITKDNVSDHFYNFEVTAGGYEMVEGVERGEEEKKKFNIIFNIKVENNMNVESLIKLQLGSLVSLLGLNL